MAKMPCTAFNNLVEEHEPYERCDLLTGAGSLQLPETHKMYEVAGCPLAGPHPQVGQGGGSPATPGGVSAGQVYTDLTASPG